jgi:anti-sigma factor RsiW
MMNCVDLKSQLIDYLDGRLSPSMTADVESHLETCPACRREAELHRRTWELAGRIDAIEPGPSFGAAVRSRVRRPRIAAIAGSCAAAAALAVALLVSTGKPPAVQGETESALRRMAPEDRRLLEELARDRTWELADNMEVVRAFEVLEGNGGAALPEEDH